MAFTGISILRVMSIFASRIYLYHLAIFEYALLFGVYRMEAFWPIAYPDKTKAKLVGLLVANCALMYSLHLYKFTVDVAAILETMGIKNISHPTEEEQKKVKQE